MSGLSVLIAHAAKYPTNSQILSFQYKVDINPTTKEFGSPAFLPCRDHQRFKRLLLGKKRSNQPISQTTTDAVIPRQACHSHADFSCHHRISEGSYYEAHQQLRVVASRYVKSSDWDSAIDILYGGALALLKAGQGGSGGDLGCLLVEVLGKAEKGCGTGEKGAYEFGVVETKTQRQGDRRLQD